VVAVSNVTLCYVNFYENNAAHSIRSGNPYNLYPAWYASVCFDRLYPGGVSALDVWVWGDSGNVSSVTPVVWRMAANSATGAAASSNVMANNQASMMPILLPMAILSTGAMTTMYVFYNLSRQHNFKHSGKMSSSKHKTAALSLLLTILLATLIVPSASASWKSETYIAKAGFPASDDPYFYPDEKECAVDVGAYIYSCLGQYAGVWSTVNVFPENSSTTKSDVISHTQSDESNYQPIDLFAFGNLYTNPNNGIYYYYMRDASNDSLQLCPSEVSSVTQGHITFAWMYTCGSGGKDVGTPIFDFAKAWTHTTTLSSNGYDPLYAYSYPSGHCFIGFQGEAPMIHSNSFQYRTECAYQFVEAFYDAAKKGETVHDSLNQASAVFGVALYSDSQNPLLGYTAYWPGGDWMGQGHRDADYYDAGAMVVFGDSNVRLVPETVSAPSISGSSVGNTAQINVKSIDGYGNNVAYKVYWGENPGSYTLYDNNGNYYPHNETETFDNTYSSSGLYTITVYAVSSTGVWSGPNSLTMNVGNDPTYTTTINVYHTWGGDPNYINYMGSYDVQLPYGTTYFDFTEDPVGGGYFMYAYDYADQSMHYSPADWYWTGYGTSIDVLWTY
jgi:hypothetical protein